MIDLKLSFAFSTSLLQNEMLTNASFSNYSLLNSPEDLAGLRQSHLSTRVN